MDDVRLGAGQLGHHQEAMHALGLELDRPAARQRAETQLAALHQLLRQHVDHPAVLAVGKHDHVQLGRLLDHREGDVVVGLDAQLDVGQPQLDAAHAQLGRVAQVAVAVGLRLPDHGVEGQVDQRRAASPPPASAAPPAPASPPARRRRTPAPRWCRRSVPSGCRPRCRRTRACGRRSRPAAPGSRRRRPRAHRTRRPGRPPRSGRPRSARRRAPTPPGLTSVPPTTAVV